jgi:hypothetical protein
MNLSKNNFSILQIIIIVSLTSLIIGMATFIVSPLILPQKNTTLNPSENKIFKWESTENVKITELKFKTNEAEKEYEIKHKNLKDEIVAPKLKQFCATQEEALPLFLSGFYENCLIKYHQITKETVSFVAQCQTDERIEITIDKTNPDNYSGTIKNIADNNEFHLISEGSLSTKKIGKCKEESKPL